MNLKGSASPQAAEITARALRGDPASQAALAEALEAAGNGELAGEWLQRAAQSGDRFGNALLGAWEVLGHNVPRNPAEGVRRLLQTATRGEVLACAFLANLYASGLAVEQSWPRALRWLTEAAKLGNTRALTQLALVRTPDPTDVLRLQLLRAAAERRNDVAQYFLGRALCDAGDAVQGERWLAAAARAGNPCARWHALSTTEAPTFEHAPLDRLRWDRVRFDVEIATLLQVPGMTERFESPAIATIDDLVPREHCEYVMGLAAPAMQRAPVIDPAQGETVRDVRTNSHMTFAVTDCDVLLRLIEHRIARATGTAFALQENATALWYRPGESYSPHFDFFDPALPGFDAALAKRGQRCATVLLYLNENYEAGETDFPELGWRYRGGCGDALVFRNVTPTGAPDRRTLHAGLPPASGEKWLLTKWIRDRAQLGTVWT